MSNYVNYDESLQVIVDSQPEVDARYKEIGEAATTNCDINQVVSNITNASVIRNHGGSVIGYDYRYTHPSTPDTSVINVDSNTDSGSFGEASGSGGATGGGGAGRFRAGSYAGSVISDPDNPYKLESPGFVSSIISPAWAVVSTLSKFGKNVINEADTFIKNTAESFIENFTDFLTDTVDAGVSGIRALFGVDSSTGETSMYLDEDTIGALAIQVRDDGFFNDGSKHIDTIPTSTDFSRLRLPINIIDKADTWTLGTTSRQVTGIKFGNSYNNNEWYVEIPEGHQGLWRAACYQSNANTVIAVLSYRGNYSSSTCSGYLKQPNGYAAGVTGAISPSHYTYDGKSVSYVLQSIGSANTPCTVTVGTTNSDNFASFVYNKLAWILWYGDVITDSAIPGISEQTGATSMVDAITGADPHVVAQNLYSQYPAIMGAPTQIVVMDDSCNESIVNYYRIPISYSPTNLNISVPVTGATQTSPSFNPSVIIDPSIDINNYISQIIKLLSGSGAGESTTTEPLDPSDPNAPSDTIDSSGTTAPIPAIGVGETPVSTLPSTVPTALWHVYNPSTSEISAFGNWLWTVFDVTSWKRLFQSPMDAVIGVHAIYGAPSVSSAASIVCGDISSPISALVVNSQYTSVSCGSIWLTEYFGNVYDYPPYTTVSIFLPFIGIVDLDVSDVMRSKLTVNYNIDVFTGACNCQISVERDGAGGVLYQYSGNCAVDYPISGASYNNILSSMIGISSSIAHIATNSNPISAAASLAFSAASAFTPTINRSGSFASNAGAMGSKIPYLIITRPQPNYTIRFPEFTGYRSNFDTQLSRCTGFTRCTSVHLYCPGAFKSEVDEIESLLRSGVIL